MERGIMGAPNVTFEATGAKLSAAPGYDYIGVTFSADTAYQAFECRATRAGEAYGVGVGTLVASFSATPAGIERTFEIYDEYLVHGDGEYRISLFVQGEDGSWNDNEGFIPSGESEALLDAEGQVFLSMRG